MAKRERKFRLPFKGSGYGKLRVVAARPVLGLPAGECFREWG